MAIPGARSKNARMAAALVALLGVSSCRKAEPLPGELEFWESDVIAQNDLEIDPGKSRIRLRDGIWEADFRDVPLWNLPLDGPGSQIEKRFPDRIRLDGAHLCGKLERRVVRWLDTASPGWREVQACQPDQLEKSVRRRLGKQIRDLEFARDSLGRTVGASLRCREQSDQELRVGVLRILPQLRRLEMEDCRLATATDSTGAMSQVQGGFEGMVLRTLVLRKVKAPFLDLSGLRPLDTLRVEQGDATALKVPKGCPREFVACREKVSKEHRSIRLVGSSVCDPVQVKPLEQEGAVFEARQCRDVPAGLVERAEALQREVERIRSRKTPIKLHPRSEVGKAFQSMFQLGTAPTWSFQRLGEVNCFRYYGGVSTTVEGGEHWIRDPWWGLLVFDRFDAVGLSWMAGGVDRKMVASMFGEPYLETKNLEIRVNGAEPVGVFQYGDHDELIALGLPSGCSWISWLEDATTRR